VILPSGTWMKVFERERKEFEQGFFDFKNEKSEEKW
jgi:hypothetical protein